MRSSLIIALVLSCPVSLAHAASEGSVIRRCLIEIDGHVYLSRPCVVTTRNGLVTLGGSDTRPAKYFAYMDILDTNPPSALVYWNGKHAGTHAQTYLGALIRHRNCWTNRFPMVGLGYSRAKLCIGPLVFQQN
jgi:hypothetical protein